MPNIKSAEKRVRVSATKRARNVAERSRLRTAVKRFETALTNNPSEAQAYLQDAFKSLDKAAAKGIIHKNAAARRKSRLTKKLAKVSNS